MLSCILHQSTSYIQVCTRKGYTLYYIVRHLTVFMCPTSLLSRPVITVVEARPIDSETTPSPTMTTPTSLPPTQLHDDQKSPGSEAVKVRIGLCWSCWSAAGIVRLALHSGCECTRGHIQEGSNCTANVLVKYSHC